MDISVPDVNSLQPSRELKADLKVKICERNRYLIEPEWRENECFELTKDESDRVVQRKENNKYAAKKSRLKKKQKMDSLEFRAAELRKQRLMLISQRDQLNEERERLKKLITRHAKTCPGVQDKMRQKLV